MPGPVQVTLKDKDKRVNTFIKFRVLKKIFGYKDSIEVICGDNFSEIFLEINDAQARKLRNWLNWYLDNK